MQCTMSDSWKVPFKRISQGIYLVTSLARHRGQRWHLLRRLGGTNVQYSQTTTVQHNRRVCTILKILLYLPNGFQGIQWFDLKTMRTKLRYGKRKLTSNHTSYTIVLNLNRARATTAAPMYVHTSISIYCFSRLIISLVSSSLLRLTVKSIGMVGLGSPTRLN